MSTFLVQGYWKDMIVKRIWLCDHTNCNQDHHYITMFDEFVYTSGQHADTNYY